MTVKELNRDQIDELKWNLYWSNEFDSSRYENGEDIPDEVVFEHYEGIDFVDDDFSCSTEPDWKKHEDRVLNMIRHTNEGKTVYHFEVNFHNGYSISIRTDYDTLTVDEAIKLLPVDCEQFGPVVNVYPISVEDMVKFYDCESYKDWKVFSKPE